MPVHVRISDPSLLADLIDSLISRNCVAHAVGHDSCLVVHVEASHSDEAQIELTFFMRAWQEQHPGLQAVMEF